MDEELKRQIEEYLTSQQFKDWDSNDMAIYNSPPPKRPYYQTPGAAPAQTVHSLAEVQLTGGNMIGMVISASTAIGTHLTKSMNETGFLYLYNDSESLLIRAEEVVAIKMTKLTKDE